MSWSKSPLAFDDVREAFERAIETEKGIMIRCKSHAHATTTRSRFNYFRKLDRVENQKVYPPGNPMHGKSVYDRFSLRIPPKGSPDDRTLYIEVRSIDDLDIESLDS